MVYLPTKSPIVEGSIFVDSADLEVLNKILKNRNFEDTKITFKQNGNGRVDYVVSKDCQFMGVQLFHFVPYAYEPFSEIYYYTDADALAFKNYLIH